MLARLLVEQRLAACVQTNEITSTYRWQGQVESAPEIMLTAKTLASRLSELEQVVKRHHSYEVPEIIATPIVRASEAYALWVQENAKPCDR